MSTTHETPITAAAPSTETGVTAPAATTEPILDTKPEVSPLTTSEPTTTAAPVSETTAPATAAEPVKEDKAADVVKVEASPITSGSLGYKAPGIIHFRFSDKYFWLGDEALEESTISQFLKSDHDNKHHLAAHGSQTGKGLFLYAKRAEDKTAPSGILNLSDASDVTKDGLLEFSFKIHAKKHAFQAKTQAERDGWIVAVNNAVTEAKAGKDTLHGSEGYKNSYSSYTKPAAIGAGAAGVGAATAASTDKKEGRSLSRGFRSKSSDKKNIVEKSQEKAEQKIEVAKENHNIKKAEKEEEKKDGESAAVATGVPTGSAVAGTEAAKHEETKPTDTKAKRQSIFSFGRSRSQTPAEAITPSKEVTPVAASAPKVDPVETGAPLSETVPTTGAATTAEPTTAAPVSATTAEPSTAAVGTTSTTETGPDSARAPSSGFLSKLGFKRDNTIKDNKKGESVKAKIADKVTEKKEEDKTSHPISSEPVPEPAAFNTVPETTTTTGINGKSSTATPAAAVASTDGTTDKNATVASTKDGRRRSIFDSILGKKDKTVEPRKSVDANTATSLDSGVDANKTKASKLLNLGKGSKTDAPAVPAKDTEVAPTAGVASTETPLAHESAATETTPLATETKTADPVIEAPASETVAPSTTTAAPVTTSTA